MKNVSYRPFIYFVGLLVFTGIASCSSYNDPYSSYVGEHEIIYPEKTDSVITIPGINKATLKISKPSDPLITKVGIFWHAGADSIITDFLKNNDTLTITIDSLEKGIYTFNIYTYDKSGGQSMGTSETVRVFGENFVKRLKPKKISTVFAYNNVLNIYWKSSEKKFLTEAGTVLYYKSTIGQNETVFTPAGDKSIVIDNYDSNINNNKISYKTYYKLSKAAIDSFGTEKATAQVESITPESDIVAKIVVNADVTQWQIPDYGMTEGKDAFMDRDYPLSNLGPFKGLEYIKTTNDATGWSKTNVDVNPLALIFLRSDIQGPVTFYVAKDERAETPQWMINKNYKKTGKERHLLGGGESSRIFMIFKKKFQPGDVIHIGGIYADTDFFILFFDKQRGN